MSLLHLATAAAIFTNLFGSSVDATKFIPQDQAIVLEGKTMNVVVPECPLAEGSFQIEPSSGISHFSEWKTAQQVEAKALIDKVVQVWERKGITDYLIFGRESADPVSSFTWEVVPYPKEGYPFWKQFNVLWNITYGGACIPVVERQRIAKEFKKDGNLFSESLVNQIARVQEVAKESDPFSNPEIIQKQRVFEGKEVNILYNYAPLVLGKEKLHFLVVPKQHRLKFSDLTESEYLEAMQLSQKLVEYYKNIGYGTAYLFDKNGADAGQSVPHWHEHVVFTATKAEEVFGRLTVLKNMLFGSSPLPNEELQSRVTALKTELQGVFGITEAEKK